MGRLSTLLHQSDSRACLTMLSTRRRGRHKNHWLSSHADDTMQLPGSSLRPNELCRNWYLKGVDCIIINGMPSITAHGPQGLESESPSCTLNSAPLSLLRPLSFLLGTAGKRLAQRRGRWELSGKNSSSKEKQWGLAGNATQDRRVIHTSVNHCVVH